MNDRQADQALRDLFREVGGLRAEEGLDARILQRIVLTPQHTQRPEPALLPTWAWYAAAALVCGLLVSSGPSGLPTWLNHVPTVNWKSTLPWMYVGLGVCVALLGLDAWLNSRRAGLWSR